MNVYRLSNSTPDLIHVGDSADLGGLLAQPCGDATVGDALASGQCSFVSGEWVVPETVSVVDGNALATDLVWSRADAEYPNQSEHTFEARRIGSDVVVKASKHVQLIRGASQVMPPSAMLVLTTYGVMSTADLIPRSPEPGVVEMWLPHATPPQSPLDIVEAETLADGSTRHLERVHRSAIASPA